MEVRQKFPCGYEMYLKTGLFDFFHVFFDSKTKGCPLHGYNCPPKK